MYNLEQLQQQATIASVDSLVTRYDNPPAMEASAEQAIVSDATAYMMAYAINAMEAGHRTNNLEAVQLAEAVIVDQHRQSVGAGWWTGEPADNSAEARAWSLVSFVATDLAEALEQGIVYDFAPDVAWLHRRIPAAGLLCWEAQGMDHEAAAVMEALYQCDARPSRYEGM